MEGRKEGRKVSNVMIESIRYGRKEGRKEG